MNQFMAVLPIDALDASWKPPEFTGLLTKSDYKFYHFIYLNLMPSENDHFLFSVGYKLIINR